MWSTLRAGRPAPFRAELDAGRIGAKAPFLAILEHVGPSNFRIRIAGDRLNRWFGLELRGMSALSMIAGPTRNHAQAALNRVVSEPAVAVIEGHARAADGEAAAFELLYLPMRSDFGRIDRVLVGLWLIDPPARVAHPFLLDAERVRVLDVSAETTAARAAGEPDTPRGFESGAAREVASRIAERLGGSAETITPARIPAQGGGDARAGLRAIDGDGTGDRDDDAGPKPPRRGHLRLVKG